MATQTARTTSSSPEPSKTSHHQLEEGRVFGSLSNPRLDDEMPKWPSLGHIILDRLSNYCRDKVIFVSSVIDLVVSVVQFCTNQLCFFPSSRSTIKPTDIGRVKKSTTKS